MITAAAVVFLTGCSGDDEGGSTATAPEKVPPAQVSLSLADGSADVSPVVPLEISVTDGELAEVTLVDDAGTQVPGSLTEPGSGPAEAEETGAEQTGAEQTGAEQTGAEQTGAEQTESEGTASGAAVWTPETPLAYGTRYTLTASAVNEDDAEATATATFTTVDPAALSTPSVGPLDGQLVGVGMPIRVYFDEPVADKAAVESNLVVTSSTPTDGVWSWLSDSEVHFRPSTYWPENIDVRVDANLYGVPFGEGVWGEKNRTVSFSIGERHVSVADASTHQMQVYDGDQLVQTFPISAGSPDNPSYNGAHVVTEMNRDRVMDSSTYGVPVDSPDGYRTPVEFAVRISDSGEFVHAAPWSVAQQGNTNMSTENARWFFEFSVPGDVVEIQGSSAGTLQSDIYDWTIPWDQWQAGSALK
jgi:lipoprotein-anchoring transpeptidase ErfK/SrfK